MLCNRSYARDLEPHHTFRCQTFPTLTFKPRRSADVHDASIKRLFLQYKIASFAHLDASLMQMRAALLQDTLLARRMAMWKV